MNYGELQASVQALLNRDDLTTTLNKTFIQQGLTRILRKLRAPFMEAYLEVTVGTLDESSSMAVPGDFLEMIEVTSGTGIPLEYLDPRTFRGKLTTGMCPKWYTRIGTRLYFRPYPTEDIALRYYSDATTLVADEDTNFLSDSASDLVTYAALSYAADYFLDERGMLFEQRYTQIFDDITEQALKEAMSQTSMVIQPTAAYDDYQGDF